MNTIYNRNPVINPETGKPIKIGGPTWNRLSLKYYTLNDGTITDQLIPISQGYLSKNVSNTKMKKKAANKKKQIPNRKHVADPCGQQKYINIGSNRWNKRYLDYEWDGHEFGKRREIPLNKRINTGDKRQEARYMKLSRFALIGNKVGQGRLFDLVDSKLGFSVTFYNTVNRDLLTMREMNENFPIKNDFDFDLDIDNALFLVRFSDRENEEEVIPLNVFTRQEDNAKFRRILKSYILKGMHEYSQCFTTIIAYNLMAFSDGEETTYNLTDDRVGNLRVIHKKHVDNWIDEYLQWYAEAMAEKELEGRGSRYIGWIGVHIEMFPLRTFIGAPIFRPRIFGNTVSNPAVDDIKCLQRCLILGSKSGQIISRRNHVLDPKRYERWWKKPDMYKVFDLSIHDIEKALDIVDKPFDQCDENFKKLEDLIKIPVNCYEVTLFPGYKDETAEDREKFECSLIYPKKSRNGFNLCIVNDLKSEMKHFMYIKDIDGFKKYMLRYSEYKSHHFVGISKCHYCDDYYGTKTQILRHEILIHPEFVKESEKYKLIKKRLIFKDGRYAMPSPIVVYADLESFSDNNGTIKPIMLSCLSVSRIPKIESEFHTFLAPNECESDMFGFIDFLLKLREKVWKYLSEELEIEVTPSVLMDYKITDTCPFCNVELGEGLEKVKHHAHVSGEYYNGRETRYYNAGEYICTCCWRCNLQLSFTKENYKLPIEFYSRSRRSLPFIMKLITLYQQTQPSSLKVVPTIEDKELMIEFNGLQFKDSFKMISSSLMNIVKHTLGKNLTNYKQTRTQLKQYCENRGKIWDNSYIDLLIKKEPLFFSLNKPFQTLSNCCIPKQEDCFDVVNGSCMSSDDYEYMSKLWEAFNIESWGDYYQLYNILDVTLLADSFEYFRNTTLKSFGIDPVYYLTAPQMCYSLFLKVTMSYHSQEFIKSLGKKWADYMVRIDANEGLPKIKLVNLYVTRMMEFYHQQGILSLKKVDMENFIRLKNNMRGGIIQIAKRYARVGHGILESTREGIYYMTANKLYVGTMYRMIPYELVGEKVPIEALSNPTNWVMSLGTFDQYGYFIECDVDISEELHDYFNDLPFFPQKKVGQFSSWIIKNAKDHNFPINEMKTEKLICDLTPKKNYLVHYSMLQLAIKQGYRIQQIHHVIKFKQAPFIFEYVNLLNDKIVSSDTAVEKTLYRILADSINSVFLRAELNRMKVKFASSIIEREAIVQKHGYDIIASSTMYADDLIGLKIEMPVKRIAMPLFIGFAILDLSKCMIYDFYYNKLKKTFESVELLGQDTDSIIVHLKDRRGVAYKMCRMYKSLDFSDLDPLSYFYKQIVKYYGDLGSPSFTTLSSFINYNKDLSGPIFKIRHNGHRIIEYIGLRPKLFCIIDESDFIGDSAKNTLRDVEMEERERKVKDIELYKKVLFPHDFKNAAKKSSSIQCSSQQPVIIPTEEMKRVMLCNDNKRWIAEDNVHTLAFAKSQLKQV